MTFFFTGLMTLFFTSYFATLKPFLFATKIRCQNAFVHQRNFAVWAQSPNACSGQRGLAEETRRTLEPPPDTLPNAREKVGGWEKCGGNGGGSAKGRARERGERWNKRRVGPPVKRRGG